MLTQTGKYALFLLVGAIVGGATGYIVADQIIKRKLEEEEAEYYEDIIRSRVDDLSETPANPVDLPPVKDEEKTKDKAAIDYGKAFKGSIKIDKPPLSSFTKERFSKISNIEELFDNDPDIDTKELTWYIRDQVLVGEEGTKIPIPAEVIGGEASKFLLGLTQDSEVHDESYYLDNENNVLYEVMPLNQSYEEDVLGITKEAPKKKKKSSGAS